MKRFSVRPGVRQLSLKPDDEGGDGKGPPGDPRLTNGRYRVTVTYESRKYRTDGQGVESEIEHADWLAVGEIDAGCHRPGLIITAVPCDGEGIPQAGSARLRRLG